MTGPLVEASNIRRTYGGAVALDGVDFTVERGEILGLIGENGAGKSTLMKILCGIEQSDAGVLKMHGKEVNFALPSDAQDQGVAMIPQEVLLIDDLSIVENIFLGHEKVATGTLCKQEMEVEASKILNSLGLGKVDLHRTVGGMAKGDQQLIAIARRLVMGGSLFILDEPTASLAATESEALFRVMRKLAAEGKSLVFISHRLEEMIEICDRIVVLRDGRNAGNFPAGQEIDRAELVRAMVGREVQDEYARATSSHGEIVLELKDVVVETRSGKSTQPISLTLRQGEVVGITGLAGIGKTELAETLSGLRPLLSGDILVNGNSVRMSDPVHARRQGIGLISEDRRGDGLILQMSAMANLTLTSLRAISRFLRILPDKENKIWDKLADRLGMREAFRDREAGFLSGGNQQKVVICRQICANTNILLMDEPTKGVDIGARAEVSRLVGELACESKAVLVFASDPREALGLADKLFIMTSSRLEGPFSPGEIDYRGVMDLQFGVEA